jgi:hypothetical protein
VKEGNGSKRSRRVYQVYWGEMRLEEDGKERENENENEKEGFVFGQLP